MIPYQLIGPDCQTFTHIAPNDGSVRIFAVTMILDELKRGLGWAAANGVTVKPQRALIDHTVVAFFRAERNIEQHRLDRLTDADLETPILFCVMPDDTWLVIDGHHRYVRRAELGMIDVPCWPLPEHIWSKYLVERPPGERPSLRQPSGL